LENSYRLSDWGFFFAVTNHGEAGAHRHGPHSRGRADGETAAGAITEPVTISSSVSFAVNMSTGAE
jgi:hypothetical protein